MRDHLHARALDDTLYVLRNSQADFPLAPELHLRAGDYLAALRRPQDAIEQYRLSARRKPDYWPAYRREAELFLRLGLLERARDSLEEGLAALPGHPQLLEVAEELKRRGKPVRPRPVQAPAGASSPEAPR